MENFKRSMLAGIIAGIAFPITGAAITMMIFEQLAKWGVISASMGIFSVQQERTIYVLGILFNLIPFHYFKRLKAVKAMNGVVMMTILAAVIWLVYYYKTLF